jgi:glycosyltransferase involved in cell wall biosynthesis
MKIDLIFPAFPPALDGIGDYTAWLAAELSAGHDVRVLTAQPDADTNPHHPVCVERVFSISLGSRFESLVEAVADRRPDWILLQYNPFSWGHWGLAPHLPGAIRLLKARSPSTRVALTIHEPFVPIESVKRAVMTTWQRWQLWRLGQLADLVFVTIEPWIERFSSWFSGTPIVHLPVGSNIPLVPNATADLRRKLGLKSALVLGVFGSGHASRLLPFISHSVQALRNRGFAPHVLYVGPDGQKVRRSLQGSPLHDTGALPGEEVSRHFGVMDLYLCPFDQGVSARRGSFLAGIQHSVPTVTTTGPETDTLLQQAADVSFLASPDTDAQLYADQVCRLAESSGLSQKVGNAGGALFEQSFSWPAVSSRLLRALDATPAELPPSPSPSVVTT